jgi:uncharacterized glyoxalase superfamily protein PhnB
MPAVASAAQQAPYHPLVIAAAHIVVFSHDAEADRAFLRDLLGTPHVDAGGGWLILKAPPAEVAVHPTDGPATQELYLVCDDIEATTAELSARGVELTGPVVDAGWGRLTGIRLPGGGTVGLYEAHHPTAYDR